MFKNSIDKAGGYVKVYTVSLFGHREIDDFLRVEEQLEFVLSKILKTEEFVEFLVGRNGDFDRMASSVVKRIQKKYGKENSAHVLVLPYSTAEYRNNIKEFHEYYDEIEISSNASKVHFKASITTRNFEMVDRADVVVCYVRNQGGAYQAIAYAKEQNKRIINLLDFINN